MSTQFVGRETEFDALSASLEASRVRCVASCQVLRGEAGSGKTRLVNEVVQGRDLVIARVSFRPALDVGGSPTVEALARALEEPFLSSLPVLAEIEDWFEADGRDLTLAPARGREPAAVLAQLVDEASAQRPVALIIEDVHWAEEPEALRLLDALSGIIGIRDASGTRAAAATQLTVLVTVRPLEATQAVGAALRGLALARDENEILDLGPLTELEIDQVVRGIAQVPPSGPLLDRIQQSTRGLPLLVEDAARRLRDADGDIGVLQASLPATASAWARSLIDDVDPSDQPILLHAALLDRPDVEVIALAAQCTEDDVLDAFDRACENGVMEAAVDGTRFTHPTLIELLRSRTSTERRQRRHLALARAFQSLKRPEGYAAHLLSSGPLAAGSDGAADVFRTAMVHALRNSDHRLAARFAEAALGLDPVDNAAETHVVAALAHFRDYSPERTEHHLALGEDAARSNDDIASLARALALRNRLALVTDMDPASFARTRALLLSEPKVDSALLAQLCEDLSEHETLSGNAPQGERWAHDAMRHARQADSLIAQSAASFALGLNLWTRLRLDDALDAFEASRRQSDAGDDPWYRCWGRGRMPIVHLMEGHPTLAAAAALEADQVAVEVGDQSERALALGNRLAAAATRADFAEVDRLAPTAIGLLRRTEYAWAISFVMRPIAWRHAIVGDVERSMEYVDLWQELQRVPSSVRPYLSQVGGGGLGYVDRGWRRPLNPLALSHAVWTASVLDESAPSLPALVQLLDEAVSLNVLAGPESGHLVPRALARLRRLSGDIEGSIAMADYALEVAERSDMPIEAALSALESAEARVAAGRDGAVPRLEMAASLVDEYGLRPARDRIEELASQLGVRLKAEPPVGVQRTLLFTDVVGSTAMTGQVGDATWVEVMGAHDAAVRACLRHNFGHQFTHTGDGIGAWFARPVDAVEAVTQINEAMDRIGTQFKLPLAVRAGIVVGSVMFRGPGLSGLDVARANRVMSRAGAREVIVDAAVAAEVQGRELIDLGDVDLRGIAEPQRLSMLA